MKNSIFQSPQNTIFPQGLTHAFGQRMYFFLYLYLVKKRLEIILNNVIDGKETFFRKKNSIFQSPKNRIFPKGLTHAFNQKMYFFSSVVFGQNKTRYNVSVRDRKESFFGPKKM